MKFILELTTCVIFNSRLRGRTPSPLDAISFKLYPSLSSISKEWMAIEKSLRHVADGGTSNGLISVDHSSLSKHLKALDYGIIKRTFDVIVGKLNRAARRRLNLHNLNRG